MLHEEITFFPKMIDSRSIADVINICIRLLNALTFMSNVNSLEQTTSMKTGVFWDMPPCGPCKMRRFGEMNRLHHQGQRIS
jgi:hypothetical protein